jgi:hypothetical protein
MCGVDINRERGGENGNKDIKAAEITRGTFNNQKE